MGNVLAVNAISPHYWADTQYENNTFAKFINDILIDDTDHVYKLTTAEKKNAKNFT